MRPRRAARSARAVLAAVAAGWAVHAVRAEPLPTPLTLDQALALAAAPHPDLDHAEARLDAARAGLTQAESVSGLRAQFDYTPQWVLPSVRERDEWVNDSRLRFTAGKRLYDFGRSRALEGAARAELEAREQQLLDTREQRRLEVMARFLDVLLADLRYMVDNEAMAHHYVNFDRARDRREVGQISDVELLEFENRYQEALIARTRSQKRQAQSRQQLALALNRPEELSAELVLPRFPGNDREPPDFKQIFELARQGNPVLLAARRAAESASVLVKAERARRYPVISVEGEAADYRREFATRDDYRATLNLRVPLWQGGEERAAIQAAQARAREAQARLGRVELDLRQGVLDAVQEIESLRIERNAAKIRTAWRDLNLDRSRALYELEVRTDLGDAMTRVTEAQWQAAQAEFRLALAWARLEAMTASPLTPAPQESVP